MIIPLNTKIEIVKAYQAGETFVGISKRFRINRATASKVVTEWYSNNFGICMKDAVWILRNIKEN